MKTLLGFLFAMMACMACSDFHSSDNGPLDGFWQLAAVDTLPNGPTGVDAKPTRVFWAVEGELLEMRDLRPNVGANRNIFFRFQLANDKLILSHPIINNRSVSDSIPADGTLLRYYGLTHLPQEPAETLMVEKLNNGAMILRAEKLRLHFRKY